MKWFLLFKYIFCQEITNVCFTISFNFVIQLPNCKVHCFLTNAKVIILRLVQSFTNFTISLLLLGKQEGRTLGIVWKISKKYWPEIIVTKKSLSNITCTV